MSDLGKLYKTVGVDLGAADTSKTLIAAPDAGSRLTIYRMVYISKTSAAQALAVAIGGVNILDLAASIAAHVVIDTGWLDGGITGDDNAACIATPAGAGPAGKFYVTYSID